MKKTLTITKEGLRFVDGDKTHKVHIEGEYFNREKGLYSIKAGLNVTKDKKTGKEIAFVCPSGDAKATVKEVFINFKFNDKGVCYQMYAKDRDGKYYNNIRIAGQGRDKAIEHIEKGKDGKEYKYNALVLTRDVTERKMTIKDKKTGADKEITVLECKLVEPMASKPKTKHKEAEKGEDLPF